MDNRPTRIRVTSREEGMPTRRLFPVIGWTGFDQAVVQGPDGVLLVLDTDDFDGPIQSSNCPVTGKPCCCKDECLMPLSPPPLAKH